MNAALTAAKAGALPEVLASRPLATRWFVRRYLRAAVGAGGDAFPDTSGTVEALVETLRWAISRLRPDRRDDFEQIPNDAWLERTSWRPMLAVASHFGFLSIPEFSNRYRRHAGESASDNLCGLWSVGPSTFYRYLDKGKRLIAEIMLSLPEAAEARLSLRTSVHRSLSARKVLVTDDPAAWHLEQAARALSRRDCASALWHSTQASDVKGFAATLQRHRTELAPDNECDLLVARLDAASPRPRDRVALQLAHAALWQARRADERARQTFELALRIAQSASDGVSLGIVYGALGKFHESRDTDRALACFSDSAEFLRRACRDEATQADDDVIRHYVASLQKLAWFHVFRNDPRSEVILEEAESLRRATVLPDETNALLEQTWGEYWRRKGSFQRAVDHQYRVLNIFERLGDTRQVLSTYNNLSLIYVEAKDFVRALDYSNRVVMLAESTPVEPYILASALGNRGIAYFWQGDYVRAIESYEAGLRHSLAANLPVLANRARYNLAEVHFRRFQESGDIDDERAGDAYVRAGHEATPMEAVPHFHEAIGALKAEVLGADRGLVHERLLPGELAAHFAEMAHVVSHRAKLVLPAPAHDHIRAHLAIANAYLAISTKEREAALALIRQHGLGHEFDSEIDALQMTFSRELTKEKVLHAQWKQKSYGVLTEERASSVLRQVLDAGSINKSGYAQLCQVGLATASKHLGTLAERGLLVQMGKGPSTRYVLPAA